MLNKILLFWWIALIAILYVENAISQLSAYIFITIGSASNLVIISTIIWVWIWFWIKWFLSEDKNEDNDNNY